MTVLDELEQGAKAISISVNMTPHEVPTVIDPEIILKLIAVARAADMAVLEMICTCGPEPMLCGRCNLVKALAALRGD